MPPPLPQRPELRAIKWRHLTFSTGQTAAGIKYCLDALSPTAPVFPAWLRRCQAAFYLAGALVSAVWFISGITLRGTTYSRLQGYLFTASSILSTLYSASFLYLPVRPGPVPENFYLQRMAVFSLLPTLAGRHAEHAVPVALMVTIPVHLALDATWQYQLCSGNIASAGPDGHEREHVCTKAPSVIGLVLGRMLPTVAILLFVLMSLCLVCEDRRDEVVELGAAAVAQQEHEAIQAAMGNPTAATSDEQGPVPTGIRARLQPLWLASDALMRLLWRVRYTVKLVWQHTLSEEMIKYALWPSLAIVVSLQILRMSTNTSSSPTEVLVGMALGVFMGHVEGKDISQVMFSQLTAMTQLAHDLVPSHIAQMLVQQQIDNPATQQSAAQQQGQMHHMMQRQRSLSLSGTMPDPHLCGSQHPCSVCLGSQAGGIANGSRGGRLSTPEDWRDGDWEGTGEDEAEQLAELLHTVAEGEEGTYRDSSSGPQSGAQGIFVEALAQGEGAIEAQLLDSASPLVGSLPAVPPQLQQQPIPITGGGAGGMGCGKPTVHAQLRVNGCFGEASKQANQVMETTATRPSQSGTEGGEVGDGGEGGRSTNGSFSWGSTDTRTFLSASFPETDQPRVAHSRSMPVQRWPGDGEASVEGESPEQHEGPLTERPGSGGVGCSALTQALLSRQGRRPRMSSPHGYLNPAAATAVAPGASGSEAEAAAAQAQSSRQGRRPRIGSPPGQADFGATASARPRSDPAAGGPGLSGWGSGGARLPSPRTGASSSSQLTLTVCSSLSQPEGAVKGAKTAHAHAPRLLPIQPPEDVWASTQLPRTQHQSSCSGSFQGHAGQRPSAPPTLPNKGVSSLNWQGILGITPRRRSDTGAMQLSRQQPRQQEHTEVGGATTARAAVGDGEDFAAPRQLLAFSHEAVTILFADIVGFTSLSKALQPYQVFEFLNELYARYDSQVDRYRVYKVETIGDCYMCATGLLSDDPEHAAQMVRFALEMQRQAAHVQMPDGSGPVKIRIGINSGPVLSGIIGCIRKRYCVVGSTVNLASRMESTGVPGRVHVSSDTYALVRHLRHEFQWECRGEVAVKGAGDYVTYLLRQAEGGRGVGGSSSSRA